MKYFQHWIAVVLWLVFSVPALAQDKVVIWWAQWEPAAALQELGNEFEQIVSALSNLDVR